jgi:hypothetical protein
MLVIDIKPLMLAGYNKSETCGVKKIEHLYSVMVQDASCYNE